MSNMRFIDDTDAQRQLGIDRLTFEALLRDKRLRPISQQGTIQFFRAADIARLRAELNPESEAEDAAEAQAVAEGHATAPESSSTASSSAPVAPVPPPPKKKGHDPAMRVHLRLTADLKWYDIADSDLQAWFDQLHPETYGRRRANAEFIKQRMEQIIALLDAGQTQMDELRAGSDDGERGETGR
jgi:hypothetical protein